MKRILREGTELASYSYISLERALEVPGVMVATSGAANGFGFSGQGHAMLTVLGCVPYVAFPEETNKYLFTQIQY